MPVCFYAKSSKMRYPVRNHKPITLHYCIHGSGKRSLRQYSAASDIELLLRWWLPLSQHSGIKCSDAESNRAYFCAEFAISFILISLSRFLTVSITATEHRPFYVYEDCIERICLMWITAIQTQILTSLLTNDRLPLKTCRAWASHPLALLLPYRFTATQYNHTCF